MRIRYLGDVFSNEPIYEGKETINMEQKTVLGPRLG